MKYGIEHSSYPPVFFDRSFVYLLCLADSLYHRLSFIYREIYPFTHNTLFFMFRLIIFLIHTGANSKSCSIVSISRFSAISLEICTSSFRVTLFLPIQRSACTRSRINTHLKAKFLGAPCFNRTIRFPITSFLLEPVVRKLVIIGTCVEKPN